MNNKEINQVQIDEQVEKANELNAYNKADKILKVLAIIGYLIVTGILLYWLIDALTVVDPSNKGVGLAFFLVFGAIIVGGIGYLLTLALSVAGLIMTCTRLKRGAKKSTLAFYIVMTVLPIVTEAVMIIISSVA